MIKRTLYFASPAHLSVSLSQLVVKDKETGEVRQVPIEDVGFVVFEHPEITYTQAVFRELAGNNCSVVFCDEKYLPVAMLHPMEGNTLQTQVYHYQVNASVPLKKQLWQQTVKAKITNQARLLKKLNQNAQPLLRFAADVKSNDSSNLEARAARYFWKYLFYPMQFRRERYGDAPNHLLNYGYIILRSAVARAIAGSGLLPALGFHHHNKYNAFCLADDVMEPYRPFVDQIVYDLVEENGVEQHLSRESKLCLLQVLTADIVINKNLSPLMVGISQTTASLVKCYRGERKHIKYPLLPLPEVNEA